MTDNEVIERLEQIGSKTTKAAEGWLMSLLDYIEKFFIEPPSTPKTKE